MIALFDRRFAFGSRDDDRIDASTPNGVSTVSHHWWLVMRRSVVQKWKREENDNIPTRSARIVAFEDLVRLSDPTNFDDFVLELIGKGFADRWGLLDH
jgi:hypothetical protein